MLHLTASFLPARRLLSILPAGALLVSAAAAPQVSADQWYREAPTAQGSCVDAPVTPMGESGVSGTARLCGDGDGVRTELEANNLAAGDAYTAWFVYFDDPSACQSTPCAPPAVLGDDPAGVLGRIDSLVANDSGAATFGATIRGMRMSSGAEVHVPIFGHGVANSEDNRALARQLLTPEEPALGAPVLGLPAAHHAGPVAVALFNLP